MQARLLVATVSPEEGYAACNPMQIGFARAFCNLVHGASVHPPPYSADRESTGHGLILITEEA